MKVTKRDEVTKKKKKKRVTKGIGPASLHDQTVARVQAKVARGASEQRTNTYVTKPVYTISLARHGRYG